MEKLHQSVIRQIHGGPHTPISTSICTYWTCKKGMKQIHAAVFMVSFYWMWLDFEGFSSWFLDFWPFHSTHLPVTCARRFIWLGFLFILKGKASEFLDVELPVLSVPVKSSNLRSESRKHCPVHLVTQVKATVESLINVLFFFISSLVPFLALPPLPVLEIGVLWTAANWQPLFTATSCFCSLKFLPPIYTPISRSPFSPLSLIFARSQSYGTS